MTEKNTSYFDCLPNDICLEIFNFVLSPFGDWKSNWINISAVSKQWNTNSWTALHTLIPINRKSDIFNREYYRHFEPFFFDPQMLLHDKQVDPSADDNIAIRWASRYGEIEIVKLLLQDKRVDPSAHKNEAIVDASSNGHTEIVKMLLQDKRVDPSAGGNWAFRYASREGHTEIVRLLLQDKRLDLTIETDSFYYGNEALEEASKEGHTGIVKLLLQDKRLNPSDYNIYNALLFARGNEHKETVKLLLQDKRVKEYEKTQT